MPNEREHIAHAVLNQKLITHLLQQPDEFSPWVATVAFYKAVHIVEAIFANDSKIVGTNSHDSRNNLLKRTPKFAHIWKHYRPLYSASLIARYLEDISVYPTFASYMTVQQVRSQLLNHRLHQIEKSAQNFLSKGQLEILQANASYVAQTS